MKKFDPTKPVQTRDGHPARIICTDAKGNWPIVALVSTSTTIPPYVAEETPFPFSADGRRIIGAATTTDLVNIPEEHEVWVRVYKNGYAHAETYPSGDSIAPTCIACLHIKFREGDGLSEEKCA